jgi:acyl carrier protein
MTTVNALTKIIEHLECRSLVESDLSKKWEDLDLDSLSQVQLLRDVEDEFGIELENNLLDSVHTINELAEYLDFKKSI